MAYTTINKHTDHFNTKIYTGNATNPTTISGIGFQPDWVWTKLRSGGTEAHRLCDAVRGATKDLFSNATDAEATNTIGLKSFNSDGYVIGNSNGYNLNSGSFVSWNWKANGAGSANTDGDINSTVSVNTTAGFSIVTYTGNLSSSTTATVGHGLGVAPQMIITKRLSNSSEWGVLHKNLSSWNHVLWLQDTDAQIDKSSNGSMSAPTSTVFSTNYTNALNVNSSTYVAYCFAEKTGYSKIGRYRGNGTSDTAPFIYTGFKPSFVLLKESTSTDNWLMMDNKRLGYNPRNDVVFSNLNNAEQGHDRIDLLSNGFKINNDDGSINQSGQTYIYYAVGQSLVGSNNVPCTAR